MTHPARARASLADLAVLRDQGLAVELVDGEIVHKAMPKPEHGGAQASLLGFLFPYQRRSGGPRGPGGWWLMSEVEVLYDQRSDVYRHDALGFRRDRVPVRPSSFPVQERPDWVCEILSPATARYDVVKKQRTLHAHGVPHYWLLDPEHETLTVLRHGPDGYVSVLTASVDDVVRAEPFDGIDIDVGELFGHDR